MFAHMIIGIDASRANRGEKTGVEWYCFHLIEALKKLEIRNWKLGNTDAQIRFVLYSDESLKGELANLPEHWESRLLSWPPKRFWTQIRLSWEMLVRPPDVLFIPAHVFPIIHPKKTVMTIHDIAAARFPESYNWFERWYSLFSARLAVKKLWKVIVPSEFVKNELLEMGNGKWEMGIGGMSNVVVVSHGYDQRYRRIDNQDNIARVLNKYSIRKPFLLSVGRWERKKNTQRIIVAFNKLLQLYNFTTLQLILVGKPGHGYQKVKQVYEQSPHKDRILMPGYVDPEDLVYIMNAAEVFVFPSLYEGFGLPVLEAMACGTPVVAGKGSSLEEVGGGACVYVDPMNVEDIARGINSIFQISDFRFQITSGLERVKMFSWERCAEETLKVLLG